MSQEILVSLLVYFSITTLASGLIFSWYFTVLHRDAMTGAFAGFFAALIGVGIGGAVALWYLATPRLDAVEAGTEDVRHKKGFRLDSNVLWGMGAFALMWGSLILLAANTTPSRFTVVLAGGIYEGMLIFLVAAGLSIIFGLMDVLNFAQGSLFMVGAYGAVEVFGSLRDTLGLYPSFFIALLAATLLGAVLGFFLEYFLIRPTYSRPIFQMVMTFGVALAIVEVVIWLYGTQGVPQMNLKLADGGNSLLTGLFAGTRIQTYWVFMILIGLALMVGVQMMLQRTRIGIIIRAGVQDSEMVEALGINVRLMFTGVFMLGAGIAALGGAVASGFLVPTPGMGDVYLLQAIAVVIVGGLGSYSGTAVSSIVLGIVGAVASHFAFINFNSDALGSVLVLAILLLVLYVRPTGLFGLAH